MPVPCCWEHVPAEAGDELSWRSTYAKSVFGFIKGARVNDRGGLDLELDVKDPKDFAQLGKTKYVSPKIYPSYRDSRGNSYVGTTIAHLAATPSPVQFHQRPFDLSMTSAGPVLLSTYSPSGGKSKMPRSSDDIAALVRRSQGRWFEHPRRMR